MTMTEDAKTEKYTAGAPGVHTINCKDAYEAAERYLNVVMNGKTSIPLKAWKAEHDKLNGEKKALTRQYYTLKDEVKEVEQIRRNVYSILREENGREQPTRKHELER